MKIIFIAIILATVIIVAIWIWILMVVDEEIKENAENANKEIEFLKKKVLKLTADLETLYERYDKISKRVMKETEELDALKSSLDTDKKSSDIVSNISAHLDDYLVKSDGQSPKQRKKRGRKPKKVNVDA